MTADIEGQFAHLWERLEDGWVLVSAPGLTGGYSIFNKRDNSALLIENDDVNSAVCKRMKDAGCEVLEGVPKGNVSVIPVAVGKKRPA